SMDPVQEAHAAYPSPRGSEIVEAPLPGLVLRMIRNVGDSVDEDEVIMVVESMKMETEINAPAAGTITEIPVKEGDQIVAGDTLAVIN
ncbi:MAG: acetyl-CoA carboxylase biotin carboxyl carrier protein subunit, partial [Spirochaetales bacterium]|nr:acetyl-CoA carboxylase biotin carboxyl carrier protein subunit [Spirochaetales bacterium]